MTRTTDIDELKKALKFKSNAEVLRTMDKLVLRKDFHRALADAGLGMDTIAKKYKDLLDSPSDKTQLGTLIALMKSLGLDKYEVIDEGARDWEDTLLKITDEERRLRSVGEADKIIDGQVEDYEVTAPAVPNSVVLQREEETKLGKELYEIINRTNSAAAESTERP